MAAPDHVPTKAAQRSRTYSSPPRRPDGWRADRPGDLLGRQPAGEKLGSQGPDQGYLLTLADRVRDRLKLHGGENADDALAGASAVGLKRASLFGRAPMMHDLTVGLTVWGFLDDKAAKALLELRHVMFEECRAPAQYSKLRSIADAVPAEVLHQPHQAVLDQYHDSWTQVIAVPAGQGG
jgi:hypothetical protein